MSAALVNGSDDCRSAQPPTENAAQPPTKDAARFVPEIKQEFDVASLGALVKTEHPGLVPWANEYGMGNYELSLEPRKKRKVASRADRKCYADSTTKPQGDYYGCPPEFYESEIQNNLSKDIKTEIKEEVLDLGCEPYYYDEPEFDLKPITPRVGFDRGLEPDHIVGATEINGKLMFLMAWKNSIDGEADLLEAKEVYQKSPQVAIRFYEDRLVYIPKKDAAKKRKR